MLTPQEIQEKTFVKAVFGGYDMETVDAFLEPLTEDYVTLYKESDVLKKKMKVLVETIEEYRRQEDTIKKALFTAQKTADGMIAEAERKCAQLLNNAEEIARNKVENIKGEILAEEERLDRAKKSFQVYIDSLRETIHQQVQYLDELSSMEIHKPKEAPAAKPFDFDAYDIKEESKADTDTGEEDPDVTRVMDLKSKDISSLFEDIVSGEIELEDEEETPKPKFEFVDLQFGKDYDPSRK